MLNTDPRRKIKVTGKESVVDVAKIVFKDPRLATLIGDLNPSLPKSGAISANTVVTCPSKSEAMAFAKKMGFSLGFDEKAQNGTKQKRAWAKMQGPGQASHAGIDPAEAALKLLEQKLPAAEVGKRLVKLCTPERLEAFIAAEVDAALQTVQLHAKVHVAFPKAKARLLGAAAVIDATQRPEGLLSLLQAYVDDADGAAAVVAAVVAPAAVRTALPEHAARVVALYGRAKELGAIERGAKDATLAKDPDGAVLLAMCAALADRVAPVSGERLKALGLDESWSLMTAHLEKLKVMLKKHEELLGRAGADVICTIADGGDGGRLPKPWPLVASVIKGLKEPLDKAPIQARDHGLGGLVTAIARAAKEQASPSRGAPNAFADRGEGSGLAARPMLSAEGGPLVSAASLQARAASGAKSVDEGTAIAERLAPTVCALVEALRPVAGDTGPAPMRRAKRRSHFDDVVIAKGVPNGEATARLVDEVFAEARRTAVAGVDRVQRPLQVAARDTAKLLAEQITVHQKNASELARAIVVVAFAIDRSLGGLLSRGTGREAFKTAVEKHGGKLLSKASLVFAEPPKA
jgi:hypothetical protein